MCITVDSVITANLIQGVMLTAEQRDKSKKAIFHGSNPFVTDVPSVILSLVHHIVDFSHVKHINFLKAIQAI